MITSEAWKWNNVTESFWKEPAQEVYYLCSRWNKEHQRRLLDLGCGIGRHTIFFAEHGYIVDAFDLSNDGVGVVEALAAEKNLAVSTQVGDMLTLPYPSATFNNVLAYHTIYHTDKTGIEQIISEIYRVLIDKGEVYLTFISTQNPSYFDPTSQRIDQYTLIKTQGLESGIPHYYVNEQEVQRLLDRFTIVRFNHVEEIWDGGKSCHYFVLAKKS